MRLARPSPRTQWRLGLSLLTGAIAGGATYVVWGYHGHLSDFAQLRAGAEALLQGRSPYEVVGPGRSFEWPFPLLYPLPAVLFALPFTLTSLRFADSVMTAFGAAALAWAITRERLTNPQWWVFASVAYITAWHVTQWSPVLAAAALAPSLGVLLACKPTLGAALWIAYPSRRSVAAAAAFTLGSLAVLPSWPWQWMDALGSSTSHMTAPVAHLSAGGPLVLLALLRWRRSDARLLAALACVPQTTLLYEAVPLFLLVRRWYEGLALVALSLAADLSMPDRRPDNYDAWVWGTGDQMVLWLYLPCLAVVLLRENKVVGWEWARSACRRVARTVHPRVMGLEVDKGRTSS
jgi:hypothetical protein